MEDPAYLANEQFIVEYANPALARQFGPIVGRTCFDCMAGRKDACPSYRDSKGLIGHRTRWEWTCQ